MEEATPREVLEEARRESLFDLVSEKITDHAEDMNKRHWLPGDTLMHYVFSGQLGKESAEHPLIAAGKLFAHITYSGIGIIAIYLAMHGATEISKMNFPAPTQEYVTIRR